MDVATSFCLTVIKYRYIGKGIMTHLLVQVAFELSKHFNRHLAPYRSEAITSNLSMAASNKKLLSSGSYSTMPGQR